MRAGGAGVVVIVACGLLAAACAGSAEVVSRTERGVVLRWDERGTGPGRVAEQAFNLCSGHGFNARRAVVLAEGRDGLLDVLDAEEPFRHVSEVLAELGPQGAVEEALRLAAEQRAPDDVTVIVVRRDA